MLYRMLPFMVVGSDCQADRARAVCSRCTADLKRVRQSDPVAMSMSRPCQETHRAVNFYIIGDPNALFVLISNGRFDNLRAQN